jgi:hypothetical protein
MNLYKLALHLEDIISLREEQALKLIINLIENGRRWSEYVQKKIQTEYNLQAGFVSQQKGDLSSPYRIFRPSDDTSDPLCEVSLAFTETSVDSCSCSCPFFSTNMIPCRHISRILSEQVSTLLSKNRR